MKHAIKSSGKYWLLCALTVGMMGNAVADDVQAYKLPVSEISEELDIAGNYVTVDGTKIHYLEQGSGDPILFIHGNPTSSYLWRNVIPHVSNQGRAIAIDLVGMGKSDKPEIEYSYEEHYEYLEKFVESLELTNITLVVHDWGAALGFDLARQNPDLVSRIAFMEGILPPLFPQPSYEALGPEMGGMFKALRDPNQGSQMVIEDNMFVEQILPGFVNRSLGDKAMTAYREPFVDKQSRDVVLSWPRQLPIAGEPKQNQKTLEAIGAFMADYQQPALLLYAEPGVLVPPSLVPHYQSMMPTLETHYVGRGFHFIQEDQPVAIGRALSDWLRRS